MIDDEKKAAAEAAAVEKANKEAEAKADKEAAEAQKVADKERDDAAKEAAKVATKNAERALEDAKEAEAKAAEVTKQVQGLKGKTVRSMGKTLVDMNGETYPDAGKEVTKPTHWLQDQINAGKAEVVED